MRIIGGAFRGTPLVAPSGRGTRPPLDRQRETIFNIVGPRVRGARVLDVFAGSGSFGLEALSRGAESAAFVETGRPALRALEANIATLDVDECATVHRTDALRLPSDESIGGPYDLVFLDPPYAWLENPGALMRFATILDALDERVARPGLVVFRLPLGSGLPRTARGATHVDIRDDGRSRVHYVHYEPSADADGGEDTQ